MRSFVLVFVIYVAEANRKKLSAPFGVSYWNTRPPARGCCPVSLVDNYLMDLGRAKWIWREVC